MSEKGKIKDEDIEVTQEEQGSSNEKPEWRHLEETEQNSNHVKVPRRPYWDTKYVVGANRNLPDGSFTSQDELRRPRLFRRLWIHYKRYWKLYTVLAIIALAAGLPILFLVIFPAIAQRLVDNASLPILSASLMNPTPDNITFSLVAQLKVPAGVTVDLKPITLNLFTNETSPSDPYIRVNLPEYHLKGNTKVEVVNDTAQILNQTQFENFLSYAVNSKEFTMQAEGATAAYLGILKAPIKLNKKVQMAGLNSIQGFSFVEAAVVFPPLADGTNLQGTVILPNPSAVTFELGNVTLNMIVGGVIIGQGRINDVLLAPGNNTVALSATVDLKTAIENLPTLLQAEAKSLVNGNVVVSASGNSTIFNGVHIPYYEQVLNNLVITGEVPLIQILVDSLDIALGPNSTLLSGLLGVFVGGNSTNLLISFLGSLTGLGSGSSAGSSSSNIFSGLAGLLGSSTSSKSTSSASLTTAKTTPASTPASTTASTAPSTITSSPALLSALLLPSASASDNLAGLFSSLLGGL